MYAIAALSKIVRKDSRIEVKVPAARGKKAYSYFREGGEGKATSLRRPSRKVVAGVGGAIAAAGLVGLAASQSKPTKTRSQASISSVDLIEIAAKAYPPDLKADMEVEKKIDEIFRKEKKPRNKVGVALGAGLFVGQIGYTALLVSGYDKKLAEGLGARARSVVSGFADRNRFGSPLSQKEMSRLELDGTEVTRKGVEASAFVKDPSTGNRHLFKQSNLGKDSLVEMVSSDIGLAAGVPINKVRLAPLGVENKNVGKQVGDFASLHEFTEGKNYFDYRKALSDEKGEKMPESWGKDTNPLEVALSHPDLAKIKALDMFTGEADAHQNNFLYNEKTDTFTAIDRGRGFFYQSPDRSAYLKDMKPKIEGLDSKQKENLRLCLETYKQILKNNPREAITEKMSALYAASVRLNEKERGKYIFYAPPVKVLKENIESAYSISSEVDALLALLPANKRKDSMYAIAPSPVIQNVDPLAARKVIARLLTRVISRAYGSIDQIIRIDIDNDGLITCLFRDDDKDRKLIRLELGDRIQYKQVLDGRTDAVDTDAEQYLVAYANSVGQRTDKISKPKNCKTGISCKGACISKTDVCRVDVPEALNRQEISDLNDAVNEVQKAKFVGVAPVEDELDTKNIRELKDEARKRGVYRYSYMSQAQLRESIRLQKANPDRQKIVREGLNRSEASKKALKSLLPQPVAGAWKDIEKISKFFGDNRPAAGILAASVLMGIPSSVMMSARDRYKEGLPESALMAYQRAQTTPVEPTSKPQLTFAVGGFSNLGSSGDKLAEYLKTPLDTSKREQWFNKTQEVIAFNNPEFNVPPTNIEKKDKDGNYNPLYLGYVAKESFGKYLSNVVGGRNEAAVDLASKLYAYGSKYRDKPLNVVSHGSGGNVVDEAAEILSRIKPPKGIDGGEVLKRLNIARLGGASFGLTGGTTQDDKNWANINNRTITSKNDPFSILPKKFAQFVSSVKGHEIEDYLTNGAVRDKIRETFGFFSNSVAGSKSSDKAKKEVLKEAGDLLAFVDPTLGKTWNLVSAIGDKYKDNPTAARLNTIGVLAKASIPIAIAARVNYVNNINRSAFEAQVIVASGGTTSPAPTKPQVIVAVGDGETSSAALSKSITDNSKKVKDQSDRGMYDQSDVIAFDRTLPPPSKGRVMGIIDTMAKSYEAVMSRSLKAGRDPEAVRLAAELYAIGNSTYGSNTTEHPAIAVVGLKQGGETAKRALDILESMQKVGSQGNVSGSYIAKQIHLVTLGTPELGFGGDNADSKKPNGDILKTPKTDLWSDGDLWGRTPFRGKNPDNFSGSNGSWVDYLSVDAADAIAKKLNATFNQRRKARRQAP